MSLTKNLNLSNLSSYKFSSWLSVTDWWTITVFEDYIGHNRPQPWEDLMNRWKWLSHLKPLAHFLMLCCRTPLENTMRHISRTFSSNCSICCSPWSASYSVLGGEDNPADPVSSDTPDKKGVWKHKGKKHKYHSQNIYVSCFMMKTCSWKPCGATVSPFYKR